MVLLLVSKPILPLLNNVMANNFVVLLHFHPSSIKIRLFLLRDALVGVFFPFFLPSHDTEIGR
jgi:hypothetical protein